MTTQVKSGNPNKKRLPVSIIALFAGFRCIVIPLPQFFSVGGVFLPFYPFFGRNPTPNIHHPTPKLPQRVGTTPNNLQYTLMVGWVRYALPNQFRRGATLPQNRKW